MDCPEYLELDILYTIHTYIYTYTYIFSINIMGKGRTKCMVNGIDLVWRIAGDSGGGGEVLGRGITIRSGDANSGRWKESKKICIQESLTLSPENFLS